MPTSVQDTYQDQYGLTFSPDNCTELAPTYDSNGNILTRTYADGVNTWTQTYSWTTDSLYNGRSKWVRQNA